VSVSFDDRAALIDVSVEIPRGTVTAIVGGDGAGKTTLLRALVGRVTVGAGSVTVPPVADIGFQSATSGTWSNLTVIENLELVGRAYKIPTGEVHARCERLLDAAQLGDARHRRASQLSGGMRQKLGFVMAMLHEPELLLLDEPTTGVDPVSRVELWSLISDAAAQGSAVALATTYLDEAERAHQVVVLDEGACILRGTPDEVLASAPGTVTEPTASSDPAHAWRRGRELHQWHPGPARPGETPIPLDMEDAVTAAAMAHRPTADPPEEFPAPASRSGEGPLASARAVSRSFGDTTAVDDVSLSIGPGEIVGLIGANGAGKTTLIRMLLGILAPSSGEVRLFGAPPSRRTRTEIGYVPQGLGLYKDLTVAENLDFVAGAFGEPRHIPSQLAELSSQLVEHIGLGPQRQLVFTCALSHAPRLLILDEPTSGVGPIARARLWDTIHAQAERGAGLLVSTHYMQEAEQCDRLVLMDLGRVVAEGTVGEIVGDTLAVRVRAASWADAFSAIKGAGLPVSLSGRDVRVADVPVERVASTLAASGIEGDVDVVPATLEEMLATIVRDRESVR
jgi:ABC-2 type transport system ATP-binding protein